MWLIGEYHAAALFSLKPSSATASGGKTLLVPTPFAIKMALLDAACRVWGVEMAEQRWSALRSLTIAFLPAQHAVVSNVFQRVLKQRAATPKPKPDAAPASSSTDDSQADNGASESGNGDEGFFQRTIGFREYAHLHGTLGLALGFTDAHLADALVALLLNVNYLGKRGGFIQLLHAPVTAPDLPHGYVMLDEPQTTFPIGGVMQLLDDCGDSLTFDRANIFSEAKVRPDKDRVTRNIVVPYRLKRASKSFTWYEST